MSRASVPQAGARADAAGGGVHRRADSRAVGAVAVVELRRRARAQPSSCSRRCATQGFITPAQEEAARRVRPRIQPYRQPNDARAGVGEGVSAPAVPQRVRRRQSARLAGAHDVSAGGAGRGRARGRRRARAAAPARARGGAGRDRSGDRRHPGDGRRRQLRAQHVQPRGAQPAAARLGVQAARLRRGARARATRRCRC